MQTIPAKTIVTRNKSTSWFGCEYNMNIYRGCSHGCLYCDSRSDCYRVDRFDEVRKKEDALRIIRDELSRKVKLGVVATGAMSDPYNPFERREKLTRHALELLYSYGFGAAIATKSNLLVRDIDVLRDIRKVSPVLCKLTITTPSDDLSLKVEPRAPVSSLRFHALSKLSKASLFCGVLLMPVLPGITDDDASIRSLIRQAAASGARFIYPSFGLTMRSGQREYLIEKLASTFPDKPYANRYRQFGSRYFCASGRAKHLWELFTELCDQYGLLYSMQDIVRAYKSPYYNEQTSFFGE